MSFGGFLRKQRKPPFGSKPLNETELRIAVIESFKIGSIQDSDHPHKHPETDIGDILWILASEKWILSDTKWDKRRATWKYIIHADGTDGRRRRVVFALTDKVEIITRLRVKHARRTPIQKQESHK